MGMKDINEILNTNYEDFIRPFPIYPTWWSAKKKGYEAHHIIPRAVQKRERGEEYDDRCIRLTSLQHIFAHYLYCKEHPEDKEEHFAFTRMCQQNANKLLADEKKFLDELPQMAEMREKGVQRGENHYLYGKHISEEHRKKISEANKGENSPNAKKVFQYDINGNIIQIFPTVKDTCIILGKGEATIKRYLHGKAPKNLPYTLSYN